jgi:hypothetical protein
MPQLRVHELPVCGGLESAAVILRLLKRAVFLLSCSNADAMCSISVFLRSNLLASARHREVAAVTRRAIRCVSFALILKYIAASYRSIHASPLLAFVVSTGMTRPYGKFPNRYSKKRKPGASVGSAEGLRIKINGRYDLEQLSLLIQQIIARLQDGEVHGIENCRLYLTPLDRSGGRTALRDRGGTFTESMEISLPISTRFKDAKQKQ